MDKITALLTEARINADENRSKEVRHFAASVVEVVEELIQQLAAAEAAMQEVGDVKDQLAAALAACESKDTILGGIKLYRAFNGDDWPSREAITALAIKPDASILKAHDAELIERCAAYVQNMDEVNAARVARAIREWKVEV